MRGRGRRARAQLLLACFETNAPSRKFIGEPELGFRLHGAEYMIITYADRCSFQRCADEAGANASGERYFATLRELYAAPQIDGHSLEELWSETDDFYCFDFEL